MEVTARVEMIIVSTQFATDLDARCSCAADARLNRSTMLNNSGAKVSAYDNIMYRVI